MPGRRGALRHSGDRHGEYGKHRGSLFTFLDHPEIAPDKNGSVRALGSTATYRDATGGFRSTGGADLYAAVRSSVSTAARQGSAPSTLSATP